MTNDQTAAIVAAILLGPEILEYPEEERKTSIAAALAVAREMLPEEEAPDGGPEEGSPPTLTLSPSTREKSSKKSSKKATKPGRKG